MNDSRAQPVATVRMMAALVESEVFDAQSGPPADWGETVFRYCTFERLDIEGLSFDGALLWSTLRGLDLYWPFFNTSIVVETRFEDCTFRGASFRGCRFVATTLLRCRFELDNLGGITSFHDTSFTECTFEGCRLVQPTDNAKAAKTQTFENVRSHACQLTDCTGFEGLQALAHTPVATRAQRGGRREQKE
jgi:uncharacterized protein YjbI with pentapeptide repeats